MERDHAGGRSAVRAARTVADSQAEADGGRRGAVRALGALAGQRRRWVAWLVRECMAIRPDIARLRVVGIERAQSRPSTRRIAAALVGSDALGSLCDAWRVTWFFGGATSEGSEGPASAQA